MGTATKIRICNKTICLSDYVEVRYTTGKRFKGGIIKGKIIELWSLEKDNHLQGRVESGWCFHDHDEILSHETDAELTCDLCGNKETPPYDEGDICYCGGVFYTA